MSQAHGMPLIFLTYRLWAALICITLMINTSVAMKDKDQGMPLAENETAFFLKPCISVRHAEA